MVENADTAGGLLQREVAHVADQEDELLLVVGSAVRLGGGFDDDDAGLPRRLFGKRPDAIGEAVVGNVDPASLTDISLGRMCRLNLLLEEGRYGHISTVCGMGAGRDLAVAALKRWRSKISGHERESESEISAKSLKCVTQTAPGRSRRLS